MTENTLTIEIRTPADETAILDLNGTINAQSETQLMDAYTNATNHGAKRIILNFADLAYMNSSGIGLLVTMLIRTNRNGQKLLAVNLSEHYRQIFELTRIDEAIGIYNSEEEAIGASLP